MPKNVKIKRRKDAPVISPGRSKYKDSPALAAARVRRRAILARTAASRSAIDELARGADMRELADLPVMILVPPPEPPPEPKVVARKEVGGYRLVKNDKRYGDAPVRAIKAPAPIASQYQPDAPPTIRVKRGQSRIEGKARRCTACSKPGHNISTCTSDAAVAYRNDQKEIARLFTTPIDQLSKEEHDAIDRIVARERLTKKKVRVAPSVEQSAAP